MAETRTPTTVISWDEQWTFSHVGVHPNMETVT
jgi:hypothetical protein